MENLSEIETADHEARNEDHLTNCIKKLFREKLISEYEKEVMLKDGKEDTRTKLFNVLITKDKDVSYRILDILRNKSADKVDDLDYRRTQPTISELDYSETPERLLLIPAKNPLEIAGVLHNLFNFLSLDDIKNCRQVSREWNYVAEPVLRKLSHIAIGYSTDKGSFYRTNDNFQYILKSSQTEIPFTALRLKEFPTYSDLWPFDDINEIFSRWGNNLKSLSIDSIRIDPYASISSLVNWSTLTKLEVRPPQAIRYQISLDTILHIKSLQLYECDLIIPENCRISPIELKLQSCNLTFENVEGNMRMFNRFVDFAKLRTLVYIARKNGTYNPFQQKVKLDMSGSFELDHLQLDNAEILNLDASNWSVGKLDLTRTWLNEPSSLTVREIRIETGINSTDLYIPQGVEKLTLVDTNFWRFKLPESIKKVCIEKGIRGEARAAYIKTLVLKNVSFTNFGPVVKKFVAREYAWLVSSRISTKLWLPYLLSSFKKIGDKKIAIGKFDWGYNEFEESGFPALVDKKSEYYLCFWGVWTAISKERFNEMMTI